MFRPASVAVVATLLLTLIGATPAAAAIEPVPSFGSNPGNLKMFRYVPTGLPAGRPVVVALHGCTQNASGYGSGAGWTQLADRLKFSVVLPEQQSGNNFNKCFNWFERGDTTRGQGEAESIAQMVRRTIADTGADPARVHVTGLSAGGAMTAVMLATYPEMFAGGGVVAGIAYRCAASMVDAFSCMNPGKNRTPSALGDAVRAASPHTGPWPTVSIWQGSADYTVAPANATELVEQWTNVHGIPATPTSTDTVAGYPHEVYAAGGRAVVEKYTITGMGHGQPLDPGTGSTQCGTAGAYLLDVNICAAWHMGSAWRLAA
ncbi:extracellular catalytic domain type 1 short-chain-length polyhydroxyalkanoate depolymerase [Actinophytocola algeriensis]|uniref:Poly(Hydroxyalkanoate) depolymerase family esterase n=1 Tax=Actinophytocola algeriensis TaxID=1768010 RepID=A0A7W7QDZ8_9PSEU|nr:PHB depolymerase family esterase [Actinophytocola algeriensis]MBB4911778.1 poly(hydroxyalkanoate) depolymerase family esterase [Actinophytocola algeriensis]MBE1477730.1 poly(hydroxyalkanoate) depolymerase family esterase [Actinophytocola algeriensis]